MTGKTPLANISREDLEPLWARLDIPTQRIAERLGVTRQGLSYKAKSLGLPPRTRNRKRILCDETITEMWMAGVCTTDIAKHFGYSSKAAITARRRLLGLPSRTRAKGTRNAGGWKETISLHQFLEMKLAERMKKCA